MNENYVNKKSPLKEPPLHNPGQSLDEKIQDLTWGKIYLFSVLILFFLFFVAYQWYEKIFNTLPQPYFWSFFALLPIGYSALTINRALKDIKHYKLGREGEKVVGQEFLEPLRIEGYHVIHDLVGQGFNIDHIIVGPGGVFTVETKTKSKPAKGEAIIDYDGDNIRIDGFNTHNPIDQAKKQRNWLERYIEKNCNRKISVQPIVVYPGWYINQTCKDPEVWVINPKGLLSFLNKVGKVLSNQDADDVAFYISRYIREQNHAL